MKVNIHEIPKEGLSLQEVKSGEELDLERTDLEFNKPVQIEAEITLERDNVQIDIKVESQLRFTCNRCLEDHEQQVKKNIDLIKPAQEESVIDITQIVREEIILDYPVKLLCSPECKGLCAKCGKNLNETSCDCKQNENVFRGINID
ncbi:MAG: DUF177 domain-containing protein [PVC group bacterium]|nr:DUF177 domain-containing protein [PVC group bacterium]